MTYEIIADEFSLAYRFYIISFMKYCIHCVRCLFEILSHRNHYTFNVSNDTIDKSFSVLVKVAQVLNDNNDKNNNGQHLQHSYYPLRIILHLSSYINSFSLGKLKWLFKIMQTLRNLKASF